MPYWFPVGQHRARGAMLPWFAATADDLVFAARGHPQGASDVPWFEVRGMFAYATEHHPGGSRADAWFEVIGSFVYPAVAHPEFPAPGPLYQIRGTD